MLEARSILPLFCNFQLMRDTQGLRRPESRVVAQIKERIPRYVKWLDQSFLIDDKVLQKLE